MSDNHDAFAFGGAQDDAESLTVEELPAMEFEPLPKDDRLSMYRSLGNPQWNKSTRNLGVSLRLALVIMEKTKPELIIVAREMAKNTRRGEGYPRVCTHKSLDDLVSALQ